MGVLKQHEAGMKTADLGRQHEIGSANIMGENRSMAVWT